MTKRWKLSLRLEKPFAKELDRAWLRENLTRVLTAEGVSDPLELSLVITDDKTIRALNGRYRGLNQVTDVLSFPLASHTPSGEVAFVDPPGTPRQLGEIVLSYPQARRQAAARGHPVAQEVARLLVHSVLHLLGYDHQTKKGRARMRTREEDILKTLLVED